MLIAPACFPRRIDCSCTRRDVVSESISFANPDSHKQIRKWDLVVETDFLDS